MEEHEEHAEPFMEGYLHLLTNAPHWAFEITGEAVSSLVAYPFIRLAVRVWVARHDAKAHPAPKATRVAEETNA